MYIGCVSYVVITISHLGAFTTDCLRHTAKMVVVDTIWQLHTLIVTRNTYPHNCLARTLRPHAQPGHVLTSMIDL